jgi:hypothetical protein
MKEHFIKHFPLHSETFAPYADLFAMTLCLVITRKLNNYEKLIKKNKIVFFFSLSSFDCWY